MPISVAHVPDGTKIGVVVTLGDGEGAQWDEDPAQGALVGSVAWSSAAPTCSS